MFAELLPGLSLELIRDASTEQHHQKDASAFSSHRRVSDGRHHHRLLQELWDSSFLCIGCWVHIQPGSCLNGGWTLLNSNGRKSTSEVEVRASWKAIQALTPDATRMSGWEPQQVWPSLTSLVFLSMANTLSITSGVVANMLTIICKNYSRAAIAHCTRCPFKTQQPLTFALQCLIINSSLVI